MQKPLKHRASMRLHLGTAEVLGTVSLLDCDQLAPGTWGLAQFFLEEPVMAVFGQPFVIRSPSATATLGGGQVLQPTPEKIRRRHFEILERVEKLWSTSNRQDRALEVAWFLHTKGLTRAELVRGAGLLPDEADQFIHDALADGRLKSMPSPQGKPIILHAQIVDEFHDRILKTLAGLHEESPLMSTHDRGKVQAMVHYLGNDALVQSSIDDLLRQKKLIGDNKRIALAEHKPKLSANQRKLKEKMIETFKEAGYQPPEIASFAPQAGGNAAALKDITEVCIAEGYLVQIGEGLYLHAEHEAQMRSKVRAKLAGGQGLTVAEIRDILATTRKFAVPLCEYLDRAGITRREGDLRYLNEPAAALA
jgi:selenocysteine-specific elongation factor